MIENIRDFLEDCFATAPNTQKVRDLKDELFANMSDRYNDLVNSGTTPEKAFRRVVDSAGNIDELVRSLSETAPEYVRRLNEQRKKTALVVTSSIAIFIFALLLGAYLTLATSLNSFLSALIFLALCTVPTIWLIYYFLSRPRLLPPNMDVSQLVGFASGNSSVQKDYKRTGVFMGIFVPMTVVLFFILGFMFRAWAWCWLIFLFIPVAAVLSSALDRR